MTIDPNARAWLQVREWTLARIEELRTRLESTDDDAAVIRGEIKFARRLLALEGKQAAVPVVSDPYSGEP